MTPNYLLNHINPSWKSEHCSYVRLLQYIPDNTFDSNIRAIYIMHWNAIRGLNSHGHEKQLIDLLRSWLEYADTYKRETSTHIGENPILGTTWIRFGELVKLLCNEDIGRLNKKTLLIIIDSAMRKSKYLDINKDYEIMNAELI